LFWLAWPTAAVETPAPLNPSEAFKAFLASPPPVMEMVFSYKKANMMAEGALEYDRRRGQVVLKTKAGPPSTGWGLDQEGFATYYARCQPGAFTVRQLVPQRGPDDPWPSGPGSLISWGRWGSTGWVLRRTGTALGLSLSTNHGERAWTTQGLDHEGPAGGGERILAQVLNLGIPNLNPGRIRWENHTFAVSSDALENVIIRGHAQVFDGRVAALNLDYSGIPKEIRYYYETPVGLEGIPNRIQLFARRQTEELPVAEVRILSMRTNERALGPEAFQPEAGPGTITVAGVTYAAHGSGQSPSSVVSNDFIVATGGQPVPAVKPRTDYVAWVREAGQRGQRSVWLLAWAALALVVPLAAFAIWRSRTHRIEHKQNTV
jgi:hypothetical protein